MQTTSYRRFSLLIVVALPALLHAAEALTPEEERDMRGVKAVLLEVRQRFEGAQADPLPHVRTCAQAMLEAAGIEVAGEQEGFHGELIITLRHKPLTTTWHRRTLYDKATVSGEMKLDLFVRAIIRRFHADGRAQGGRRASEFATPEKAPFLEAWCRGFIPSFAATIAAFWHVDQARPLSGALKHTDACVRRHAAMALGKLTKSPAAAAALLPALSDESPAVRAEAARSLGRLPAVGAARPLLAALKDPSAAVRATAAAALGKLGQPEAVEPLIAALTDQDWRVRGEAATSLGQLKSPRAVTPLAALVRERRIPLTSQADDRDVERTTRAIHEAQDRFVRRRGILALAAIGEPALDPLIEVLHDTVHAGELRGLAARGIGEIGGPAAIRALAAALTQRYYFSQRGCIRAALVAIGKPAVPELMALLNHDKAEAREEAARALGAIGDKRAAQPLIERVADDKDHSVRGAAASALGRMRELAAVDALIAALTDDESSRVRAAAAKALGRLKARKAIEALRRAVEDKDEWVKRGAVEALRELGAELSVDALIQGLSDEAEFVRRDAIEALTKLRDPRVVPALISVLKHTDSDTRRCAVHALGEIGEPVAVDDLIQCLDDKERRVSYAAREALRDITGQAHLRSAQQWRAWWARSKADFLKAR